MNQKNRQTTEQAAWEVVDSSPYGILSMTDRNGNPYGVPLNLWRDGSKLYFHCAMEGQKSECLRNHPQVSLCFVSRAELLQEQLTTRYTSAILSGIAEEVTRPAEKLQALKKLCRRCGIPETDPAVASDFSDCLPKTAVWQITVYDITGKSAH